MVAQLLRVGTFLRTALLDIVAPPLCLHCKKFLTVRALLCGPCKERIIPVSSTLLPVSGQSNMTVFAVSAYQDPIRSLIMAKSWSDRGASKALGELMADLTHVRYQPVDLFVPIPLHWTRFAARGYNQAEEMARILAPKHGAAMVPLLKRIKRTPFQSSLSMQQRGPNVRHAFSLIEPSAPYRGKHIMLVDDLMTTGATLQEAARALVKLKPASINAVVAARVV